MATYYDEFTSYGDLPYGDNLPPESAIVYAGYTYEDYSGSALIVFWKDGELYENHDWHCSCFGLEEWNPEKALPEAIANYKHWPGLVEALAAHPAPVAVDPQVTSQP